MKKLTKRQQMFLAYLLVHGNGALAAREAGYSEAADKQTAWELLNAPKYAHVAAEYNRRLADTKSMAEIARQAIHESCMTDLRMDKLRALDPEQLDPAERAAIAGITQSTHVSGSGDDRQESSTISLKFGSRAEARKMLFKLHGMDRGQDNDDSEWDDAEDELERAMARLEARRKETALRESESESEEEA